MRDRHKLTEPQTQAIREGFKELTQAATRFGKKDWIIFASGQLFNLMVAKAFAPTAAKDLFDMFATAVTPLVDAAHGLLGPDPFA